MSWPITAVGPLKVETTPILMDSPAPAGAASASAVAPASQNAVLIITPPPRYFECPASQGDAVLCAKSLGGGKHEPRAPPRTFGSCPAACTIVRSGRGWPEL